MAFILEKAGGIATTGSENILDIVPKVKFWSLFLKLKTLWQLFPPLWSSRVATACYSLFESVIKFFNLRKSDLTSIIRYDS